MGAPPQLPTGRVRGIVFDLDGTLVDGYQGITSGVNAARAAFGLAALREDDVRRRVGHGLSHLMEDVVGAARAAEAAEIFRSVYDRVCVEQTRPVPGLIVTLAALRAEGIRLGVASNKPAVFSRRILDALAVGSLLDAVFDPESAGAPKPDPAMILSCLSSMSIRPDEALYVGDMAIDAEAGLRAGVAVVLVAGGSCAKDELKATGHVVLDSLTDLLALLPRAHSGERGPE